jgi:TPR repeat protein
MTYFISSNDHTGTSIAAFSHAKISFHAYNILRYALFLPFFFCAFCANGYAVSDDLLSETIALAREGNAQAQFSLAMIHDQGYLLPRSPKKAAHWLTKAAEQNLPAACLYLGIKYEFGNGVEQNKKIAEKWYKKPAEKNWAMAQYLLAELYLNEKETTRAQLIDAAAWLQLASEQDYPGAKEKLQEIMQQLMPEEKKLIPDRGLQLINNMK